jgi:hypothetical protein
MPMIDPDEIKPTIDSVQAAFAAYSASPKHSQRRAKLGG